MFDVCLLLNLISIIDIDILTFRHLYSNTGIVGLHVSLKNGTKHTTDTRLQLDVILIARWHHWGIALVCFGR